jgi:peptidoglycan/xylan/chitin deacetylase (PgdA/CDA1 family)
MIRIDRFLTLFFFQPLLKRRIRSEIRTPILMYHAISSERRGHRHPYYETSTSPSLFARQLEFLSDKGYEVIGIEKVAGLPFAPQRKMAVITFDDGFCDLIDQALPLLRRYRFPATVFLPAGLMGRELAGRSVMTWEQARQLALEGVSFGSHSISHRKLIDLSLTQVQHEIRHSKEMLESRIGRPINSFAYPYAFPEQDGRFMQHYRNMLESSGYCAGVTTVIGTTAPQDDRFFLKRLPINDFDDLRFFEAKLEGAYDWLRLAQRYSKKIRHRFRNL